MPTRTRDATLMTVKGTWLVVAAAVMLAACEYRPTHYVQVAEALSSSTLSEPIRVAPVAFTDFQRVEVCKNPLRIHRLDVAPTKLEMKSGTRYDLRSLSVVAMDEREVGVPGVPVVIEVEDTTPSHVQLRADDPDIRQGHLLALEPGEFHVRVRTVCMVPPVPETVVYGRVTE